MTKFIVWEDGKKNNAIEVESSDMNAALDAAAAKLGFVDYSDLMTQNGWNSEDGDGLNIEEA